MTCPKDGCESKSLGTSGLPRYFSMNDPVAELLGRKFSLATPVQSERPSFISDPVAYPIIIAHIDQNLHPTFEEGPDVFLRRVERVLRSMEITTNIVVARSEVGRHDRIHSDERPRGGIV